jgi:hypothetical protein
VVEAEHHSAADDIHPALGEDRRAACPVRPDMSGGSPEKETVMSWHRVVIKGVGKEAGKELIKWVWTELGPDATKRVKNHFNKDAESKLIEARVHLAKLQGKLREAEIDGDEAKIAELEKKIAKAVSRVKTREEVAGIRAHPRSSTSGERDAA